VNPWQIAKQLRFKLAARTWSDVGGLTVFGSVVVTTGDIPAVLGNFRSPSCAIKIGSATADPEQQKLITQTFDVLIAVALHGDPVGQAALVGHGRTLGQTASQGRGILEVEKELKAVVFSMTDQDGVRMILSTTTDAGVVAADADKPFAVGRIYSLEAKCCTDEYYHPPKRLVATGGAGSVTLSWALPPTRFDTLRVVLRRAAGATAPTSATAGTGVTLSGPLATTVVDTVAAGAYSYAIFMAYDETGNGNAERYSEQEVGTTRTATAT
jgi:hypothetical protein